MLYFKVSILDLNIADTFDEETDKTFIQKLEFLFGGGGGGGEGFISNFKNCGSGMYIKTTKYSWVINVAFIATGRESCTSIFFYFLKSN